MNILRPALILAAFTLTLPAQVPLLINYQGRVVVGTTNFNGTGQFKFALVNTNGTTTFWSNNNSSVSGGEPTAAVSLAVTNGLYSVLLGDTTLANMTATIPGNLFNNLDVRLRVWFNDGTNGSQLLSPDQRIGSVGYAGVAGTVPDNAITTTKISTGAVQANNIGTGAVTSAKLASGLTLAGTTSGTFSGSLSGNASTATSAASATTAGSATNFTGSLAGDVTGTQGATQIAAGAVGTNELAAAAVNETKIGAGQVVKSLNSLKDTVTLAAGTNVTITPSGNTLTFASTGGSGPWLLNGTSAYYNGGNVGIGTLSPVSRLDVRGSLTLDAGSSPAIYTGTGSTELDRYLLLINSFNSPTASGLKAGGLLVADSYSYANPGKNDLIVKGNVGIGTATPSNKLTVLTPTANYGLEHTDGSIRLGTFVGGGGAEVGTITNHPLSFFTANGAPRMTIAAGGHVGIGTTTPTAQLSVAGDFGINQTIVGATMTLRARAGDTHPFWFVDSAGVNAFLLDTNGSPNQLHLIGEAYKTVGGSWGSNSDGRVKKNIRPLSDALEKLTQLRGVSFDWVNPADHGDQTARQAGFVAQEVERVFPQWIALVAAGEHDRALTDDGQIKSLTLPFEFDALVVEAIKEQQEQIKARDAKIAAMEVRLTELEAKDREREARLEKLEQFLPRAVSSSATTADHVARHSNVETTRAAPTATATANHQTETP